MKTFKRFTILSMLLFSAIASEAGTNTGKTCCCVGPFKRYHAEAYLSKQTVNWVQHYTGEVDPYGNPKWVWLPIYVWSKYKTDTKHICYSNTTAEVYDGWNVSGVYRDAKAHAERGPSAAVQWSWSNNPQIHAGSQFSFLASQEINFDQFADGTANSQLTYDDIRVENGQLSIDNMSGFNAVSNTSIFESSIKIIVYKGKLENFITGDLNDEYNQDLDISAMPVVYETTLDVKNTGVTGTGILYDNLGQNVTNDFSNYNLTNVQGVTFSGFSYTLPLNTNLPDDSLGVLILADNGISFSELKNMYGYNGGNGARMAKPESGPDFSIAPNPSSGRVKLSIAELDKGGYAITVYDANGAVVKRENLTVDEKMSPVMDLDLTGVAGGTYYVNISGGKLNQTKKLVIQ